MDPDNNEGPKAGFVLPRARWKQKARMLLPPFQLSLNLIKTFVDVKILTRSIKHLKGVGSTMKRADISI